MNPELHVFPTYENLINGASRPAYQMIKSLLFRVLACRVKARLNRQSTVPSAIFMLGDGLRDQLEISAARPGIVSFDEGLVRSLETLDPAFVFEFCDRLYRETSAFAWRGLQILDICQLRWLPVALEEFAKVLAIRNEQLKIPAASLHVHGFSNAAIARLLGARQNQPCRGWAANLVYARISAQLEGFLTRVAHQFSLAPMRRQAMSLRAMPGRPTLLVVASFDRTLERLIQMLPELRRQFDCAIHVLCTHERVDCRKYEGVEALDFSYMADWLKEEELERGLVELQRHASALEGRLDEIAELLKPYSIHGIPLFSVVRPRLEAVLRGGTRACLMSMQAAARAMDSLKPFMVLNFEDWELNRSATRLAQQRGIPALAYYCLTPSWYSDALISRSQHYMAVSGRQLENIFSRQYDKMHLRVIGDPVLSDIGNAGHRAELREIFRKRLGIGPAEKVILMLSSYPILGVWRQSLLKVLRSTANCAKAISNTRMIIKAHPAQSIAQLQNWLADEKIDAQVIQDGNLFGYCCAADLVSATISSSTTQALLAQVPVVCFVNRQALELYELRGNDYLTGGGIRCLDGEDDYVAQVSALLHDTKEREWQIERGRRHVAMHVGGAETPSGAALADFMQDILAGNISGSSRFQSHVGHFGDL